MKFFIRYVKFILETRFKIPTLALLKVQVFSDSLDHMASHPRRPECSLFYYVWGQDFIAIIMRKLQTGLSRNCGSIPVRDRILFLSSPAGPVLVPM
jgi:hypothetical protein